MKKILLLLTICITFFSGYAKPTVHSVSRIKASVASVSSSFSPTTVGWYRITTLGNPQGGTVQISGYYANNLTDVEFQYDIGGYGNGGSVQQTRFSSYGNGFVDQVRISSDGAANTYLDIHISVTNTGGTGIVYLLGDGPYMPSFISSPTVGATSGSTSVSVLTLGHGFNTTSGATFGANVGIGTTSPSSLLTLMPTSNVPQLRLLQYNTDGAGYSIAELSDGTLRFNRFSSYADAFTTATFDPYGNVGIGTSTPDAKLTVNGTIHTTEVKVDLSVPGPDYVFNADYKLPNLTQLKAYLDKNHHLPEIPTAVQMAKEGINLGDMNTKLLKKVEELTLYLIEKDKEVQAQRHINQNQNKLNRSQQQQLNELKKQMLFLTKRDK